MGWNLTIVRDPEKYGQKETVHGDHSANDPIDDLKTNLRCKVVSKPNSSVYEDFVYVYIAESAWDNISNNNELFIAYVRKAVLAVSPALQLTLVSRSSRGGKTVQHRSRGKVS